MKVGDYCMNVAIAIFCGADIAEAARLMRDQHVGFLGAAHSSGSSPWTTSWAPSRD